METAIQIASICTSRTVAATRRDWRQIGSSRSLLVAVSGDRFARAPGYGQAVSPGPVCLATSPSRRCKWRRQVRVPV